MVIACDVDDVVCDLVTEWVRLYNRDYFDTLSTSDITEWDIFKFVKPECGKKIYDYLDSPFLYDYIYPIVGSIDGVLSLRDAGHRVVFVTSAVNGCAGRKLRWLQEWGYFPEKRKSEKDYIECHDKALIRADVIIDDGPHNLRSFIGKRVQFLQPWNVNEFVPGAWLAGNWAKIPSIIKEIQNEKDIR